MSEASRHDAWQAGDSYNVYMGRWSRQIAPIFLDWLDPPEGLEWLEVGCGTGALSSAIVASCNPKSLFAIDASPGFLATAQASVTDPRVTFHLADAQALPLDDDSADVAVSALVLNFVPDRARALAEMSRVARPRGTVAFYVWDYPGGGVEFMRAFWTAAAELDPGARELTEDSRFRFCTREGLADFARRSGLRAVESRPIEVPAVFADFADFWRPFTLGAGPAPGYCMNLDPEARQRLEERLRQRLTPHADGPIPMKLRAWAVRGVVS